MSLVYEALQKAEKEKGRKTGATSLTPPAPIVEPPAPAAKAAPTATPPVAVAAPAVHRPTAHYLAVLIAFASIIALGAIVYFVIIAARHVAPTQPSAAPPAAQVDGAVKPVAPSATVTPASDSPAPAPVSPNSTANDARFKLTGIMKLGDKFGAVVNGHIVYEGQYVEGAIVKTIERDRVTLNIDGHETVIRLF